MAAEGYSAGNLFLSISASTQSAEQGIQRVINSLSRLSGAIKKISGTDVSLLQTKLTATFKAINASISSINVGKLQQLSVAMANLKNLSYIPNINKIASLVNTINSIDYTKVSAGFAQLATAIQPFIEQLKIAGAEARELNLLLTRLGKANIATALGTATGGKPSGGKGSSGGALRGFLNFSSLYMAFFVARRLGQAFADIAQSGADYVETLNLWETAMRENVDLATDFVDKMNEAYGVSRKTLMNAQAIFKNMIGSLGLISEEGAYAISEGITQMAIDYSSLYNVTLESAMTRFQSALAGQVRPIRSIAGYDITEITLYQLYQTLGGTKTMRQLTRTEKQLLSIYAIFNQMDRSGAVGDMAKTIESYANQSRVLAESWKELKTWIGTLLTFFIQQKGILVTINKYLIYYGEILKAVAVELNAIQSFGGDPFAGTEDSANSASKAVDELSGKLLDFDKFRALNTSKDEDVDLDSTVLNALANYSSVLSNATMEARRLANEMLFKNGWFDENGIFNKEKLEETKKQISAIGTAAKVLFGFLLGAPISKMIGGIIGGIVYLYTSNEKFRKSVNRLFVAIVNLISHTLSGLSPIFNLSSKFIDNFIAPILTFVVNLTASIVELIDKIGILEEIIVGILAYNLVSRIVPLATIYISNIIWGIKNIGFVLEYVWTIVLKPMLISIKNFLSSTTGLIAGLTALAVGVYSFISAWGDMGWGQRIITMLSAITAGAIGLVVALKALHLGVPAAIALGSMLAGGVLLIGSQLAKNSVTKFANGGMPDKGTMFVAGEAGAKIVYNNANGQSGVANISQIEQAMYGALVRYGRTQVANGQPIEVYLDGEKVYENTTAHAKRRGKVWSKA